jgi:hypothetical protein
LKLANSVTSQENNQRGEKSTAQINRTKTCFVNRFGQGSADGSGDHALFSFSLFASVSFFASMRVLLTGILGGVVMFVWTSIAHMALPLGEAGITEIPNESAVLSSMQSNIGEKAGLYIFPGLSLGENASREEKSQAMKGMQQKIAANPSGILMYHPPGRQFAFGKSLAIEFSTELLEGILVIWLLAQTQIASFGGRVGFVLVAGMLAAMATNVSYWNWYGFPGVYTASYMVTQLIGFLTVGIVAGLMLRRRNAG